MSEVEKVKIFTNQSIEIELPKSVEAKCSDFCLEVYSAVAYIIEPSNNKGMVLCSCLDYNNNPLRSEEIPLNISYSELAKYSNPPVINGLTNMYHPCQILADLVTIREKKDRLEGINLTYTWGYCQRARPAGVCNSLLFGSAKTGVNITIACPEGYEPDNEVYEKAKQDAKKTGAKIQITNDLKEGIRGADVIYTKNYAPAGLDKIKEEKLRQQNKHWIMTKELFNLADPEAIFMHCMPVYRDQEVTSEVVDGPRSAIYDEANNRLHAQKAVLAQVTP